MLTGRVEVRGHVYYVPLLPCVTDFASIPALELPQSATPMNLQPAIGDMLRAAPDAACDNQFYTYFNVPPPRQVFLPVLQRP
jgi:hypothetical protein